ncbi:MAG: 50S ribosomal protein L18 [Chloroflexia bacterium]|jgi:large subunit ribosomal protein L18|nr:50S ribosomal protein L18 [Chloroflexia bacterium]
MRRRTPRNITARKKRHFRVRGRVGGTVERPRLNVFRSGRHIYAQVIDDTKGHTLAAASTLDAAIKEQMKDLKMVDEARHVGVLVGQRAQEQGVTKVVFDRGGWQYHGRVQALAEGARESGLDF